MKDNRSHLNDSEKEISHQVIDMANAAYKAVDNALQSLYNLDKELAQKVIDNDQDINAQNQKIEESCILTIARQQPVATDLRGLVANMYVACELERIADYAVNIASFVVKMETGPERNVMDKVKSIAQKSQEMLKDVICDYEERDQKFAREIAIRDDQIDEEEIVIRQELIDLMNSDTGRHKLLTDIIVIVHYLERIGDRVTNIAEKVVFIATGKSVKLD